MEYTTARGQLAKHGDIIKATAHFLTDKRIAIDSVSRLMMFHAGIHVRIEPGYANDNGTATDTGFVFFELANATEVPLLCLLRIQSSGR